MTRRRSGNPVGEQDDSYPHVELRWDFGAGKATRVIRCKHGIQWIVQHWLSGRWRSQSYCRSRDGLVRLLPGKADDIVAALPEWIGG